MNSAAEVNIERDLIRWQRGKWVAVVLAALSFQCLLLFLAARDVPEVRTIYPREPTVRFAHSGMPSELLELQDASLFASANPRGFSGLAWMVEPLRSYLPDDALPGLSFLSYVRLRKDAPAISAEVVRLPHVRPEPEPSDLTIPGAVTEPASRVRVEGFANRHLVALPKPPVQYATDAVRPTVVQSLVDADGVVLSARVLESSGSKPIDTSAMELARKARFAPLPAEQREAISIGKITFEWQTLDASGTNATPARPAQK
jgi:TonB family protein